MNINNNLNEKINNLPQKPGCYLWKNINNEIIYVGKAKNLRNRVKNYFSNKIDLKTKKLVNEIADIDYLIVSNENESLVLESKLISTHKPKYNILLRENLNFPYIVVTKELHPRILYTHNKNIKGTYYGPFAISTANKYDLFNFLNKIFPFRKCSILPKKKCIYYDIKQCLGPCIKKITHEDYSKDIALINDFFSGNISNIDSKLKEQERKLSENLLFEEAKKYFELRKNLKVFSSKQEIIFSTNNDEDIIGYSCNENILFLIIFKYVKGILLSKYEIINEFFSDLEEEEVITQVYKYYSSLNYVNKPQNIYLSLSSENLRLLSETLNIKFLNPVKGTKKEAMGMALSNSKDLMKRKYLHVIANNQKRSDMLIELKKILNLNDLSKIEVFDNSFLFSGDKVSAMVVYENGIKNKNLYRKFILNDKLNSDFDYMKEVIYRRYKNFILKKEQLPNLIIVDGGSIQVKAAIESLKLLELDSIIPVIGLAKNNFHKTDRIIKWDYKEILLDKKSNLYFFLLEIQDEIHRFAITFFRNKQSKSLFSNSLMKIKGLGKKRINKLIEKFETIEKIKMLSIDELAQVVPREIAIKIKNEL